HAGFVSVHGVPDPTFGQSGIVQLVYGAGPTSSSVTVAGALALTNDGKLAAAGTVFEDVGLPGSFAIALLKADGSLDQAFGMQGSSVFPVGDSAVVRSITVQPDGFFVMGGRAYSGGWQFALARVDPAGALDMSFGNHGIALTSFGEYAEIRG